MAEELDQEDVLSLGQEDYYLNTLDCSVSDLLKKTEVDPKCMDHFLMIGQIKLEQKKYGESIQFCTKAFEVGRANAADITRMESAILVKRKAQKCLRETCDGTIDVLVGDERHTFKCSRLMLSQNSAYFKALIDFYEDRTTTHLENISPKIFQHLLDMMRNPTNLYLHPKLLHSRRLLLDILTASMFLNCPIGEVLATKAIMELEHVNEGNIFQYMIHAKAHGCTTLLERMKKHCKKIYKTLENPYTFDDALHMLEKNLDEFQGVLDTVTSNGLAFFLILGWIEFEPRTRVAYLEDLMQENVIPEILTERDISYFDPNMYSFRISVLDKVGGKPDRRDMRKHTWPKITLLVTNGTDSTDYEDISIGKQGIWFHEVLDGTFKWKRLAPFHDKEWADYPGWNVCTWDQTLYFIGGPTSDIWTFAFG